MSRGLYHPGAFDTEVPNRSYWADSAGPPLADDGPLAGETRCDVAIVGGGYTGLWAARRLAAEHGRTVRVLEAGPVGWGASGRNGGFACLGGARLSHDAIAARVGPDEARRFLALQRQGIETVRDLLAGTPGTITGEGEVVLAHRPGRVAELEHERAALSRLYGVEAELLTRDDLVGRGLSGPAFHGGLHVPVGFGVHPMRLLFALLDAARGAGAVVHPHTRVAAITPDGDGWRVSAAGGTCRAGRVIIATNGYGRDGPLPAMAGRLLPALSNILVTRPLSEAERVAQGWTSPLMAYDTRRLLHYFRLLPDGRFLFGGRGGLDADPASEPRARAWLTDRFHRLFPAWRGVEITHFWRGFACLSADMSAHAGALAPGLWFGGAYHGNGVALSAAVGGLVADLAAGAADPGRDVPALMRGPPPRFALPALRRPLLRAAYAWFRLRDGLP